MLAIILVLGFFIIMSGVGIWGMKKTKSLNDFFLGGRNIGPWVSAVAYGTTYFSAVLFIGFAGKFGWGFGLNALWIAAGNVVFGTLLAWLVLGKRTRRMTQNLNVMTMPEFMQERFQGRYLKFFSAMIIFIFLLPYSASVFKGLGHLFEINFSIPYDLALLVMIIITGFYLVLGGYFAITLNDFIQGIIMIFGTIAMVYILTTQLGGFSSAFQKINIGYQQHIGKPASGLLLWSLVFMTSFGTWGLPQMIQKFYAIKNEQMIPKAAIITTIFSAIIGFSAYYTGALSHAFFNKIPLLNGQPCFDLLVPEMLKGYLPSFLMALILLLVLSASMSTLSSLVLVSSSAIAIDLYKGHVNPKISRENSLFMIRFLNAVFIVLSYFIAKNQFSLIVTLMALSWGAVAGSFMAPYLYGLYWKKTTRTGIAAGMSCGLTTAIVLFFVLGPANAPIASSIAMILPFIVVPVVSLATTPPSKTQITKAFKGI